MISLPPPQLENARVHTGSNFLISNVVPEPGASQLEKLKVLHGLVHGVHISASGIYCMKGFRKVSAGMTLEHLHKRSVKSLTCGEI